MAAPTTVTETIERAAASRKAGRFAEAERLYCEVLQHEPANPEALHAMALLRYKSHQI